MDREKRKILIDEYKNRKPDMGIISVKNKKDNISFLSISKDNSVAFNSIKMKLKMSWHPNNELQKIWNSLKEDDFEFSIIDILKYDNPADDQGEALEELLETNLLKVKNSKRLEKKKK